MKANPGDITYEGNTQAVIDTMSGVVTFTWQCATGVLPLIKAGRLRALAVSSSPRWEAHPDVPTDRARGRRAEDGKSSWIGVLGPARLPKPIVDVLSGKSNAGNDFSCWHKRCNWLRAGRAMR